MRPVRPLLLVLVALAALLLPAASAAALSYPVTSTADTDVKGTLRGSIEEAEAHFGADSIPIEITGTIKLASALPSIDDDVTITGPGAESLTVVREASAAPFGVLEFLGSTTTVSGIAVRGGVATTGAGILNGPGELTLVGVVVAGNEASAEGGTQAVARGGGVASTGPLTVRESTIAGNEAIAEGGASQTLAAGGGIDALSSLELENSTVSGNAVRAFPTVGNPALSEGGGVLAGQLDVVNATITRNGSTSGGVALGANLESPSPGLVRNTIVADPQGEVGSCSGPLTSGGFNLDEDGSCEFGQGSDLNGLPAGLDPLLRDNGGPTPTQALLSGSIAIDRGNSFGASADQRGLPRPSDFLTISNKEGGDGSDIGAFELQAPPAGPPSPTPILVGIEPGDSTPPRTRIVSGPARSGFERLAKFRFISSEAQSSFRCKLDGKRWRKCRSPYRLTVKPGKHLFKVRAIDRFGNADRTPVRFGWRVKPVG
jgi:hypothetical protein